MLFVHYDWDVLLLLHVQYRHVRMEAASCVWDHFSFGGGDIPEELGQRLLVCGDGTDVPSSTQIDLTHRMVRTYY